MSRGRLIVAGLALGVVVAGVVGFLATRDRGTTAAAARRGDSPRLDADKLRASYRERLERARMVVERRRRARAAAADDAGAGSRPKQARPPGMPGPARSHMEPQCILGPAELCLALDETTTDCDDGDGQACLAIGQYLEDTPPRPLITIAYFLYACRAGEEEGCARMKELKEGPERPCADDIAACAWRAYRNHDDARLDEACSLGVADACASMLAAHEQEPEKARAYLEIGCQLGSPLLCNELGRRLVPGCRPEPDAPCFPPDPDEAAEAREMACEAGFADACG